MQQFLTYYLLFCSAQSQEAPEASPVAAPVAAPEATPVAVPEAIPRTAEEKMAAKEHENQNVLAAC